MSISPHLRFECFHKLIKLILYVYFANHGLFKNSLWKIILSDLLGLILEFDQKQISNYT